MDSPTELLREYERMEIYGLDDPQPFLYKNSQAIKDDWGKRLPGGLVEMSERLLIASGSPGYGPRMMRASKQPWMPILGSLYSSRR